MLALVDTDYHDILNLGWDDKLEYETVHAKNVVQAKQTDQEIEQLNEQLNEQLFQQSGGGHGHEQEKHGDGPLNVASPNLVCTKENTPKKMTTPKKETTLDSFVMFDDGTLIQMFNDGSISIESESWSETF